MVLTTQRLRHQLANIERRLAQLQVLRQSDPVAGSAILKWLGEDRDRLRAILDRRRREAAKPIVDLGIWRGTAPEPSDPGATAASAGVRPQVGG